MSEVLRAQLQAVYERNGALTPELVVDTARDPGHPLHGRFQWDDREAGEAWRRQQASELIRSVRVVYRQPSDLEGERTVRAFHCVPSGDGHSYIPLDAVVADPMMTKLVLDDMEREWKQLQRRYGHFREFLDMVRRDVGNSAA